MLHQQMDEMGIAACVHISAVIAIVMDCVFLSEVNLIHRTEPLNYRRHFATAEDLTQACSGRVAHGVKFLVCALSGEQIEILSHDPHGEAVAVEGAVVWNHLFAPEHAI